MTPEDIPGGWEDSSARRDAEIDSCVDYVDGLHCDHWFAVDGHCCQCQADNIGSEPRDDGEIPSAAWCMKRADVA